MAHPEGRGCVEATDVSHRVSSSVDEGTAIKAPILVHDDGNAIGLGPPLLPFHIVRKAVNDVVARRGKVAS